MTSKDKTRDRAPREDTLGPLLDRLKPGEAARIPIFQARLMRSRDHSCGNWSMGTLQPRLKTKYELWITRILRYEASYRAWTRTLEICKGMVLGLYRLSEREGGDILGWASDFAAEVARNSWKSGMQEPDNPKSRDIRRKRATLRFLRTSSAWFPSGSHDRAYLKRDDVIPTARP